MKRGFLIIIILAIGLLSAELNTEVLELNSKAEKLINEGEYYMAIDSLMKAHPMDKNHIETYYNLGLAYQKLYDFEKSLEYYAYALRAFPNRMELRWNLFEIYEYIGQYAKASEHLDYYISLGPDEKNLAHAEALLDSLAYRDSCMKAIVKMEPEDVVLHNEGDKIYYAFRGGFFYSDSSDTILLFSRGEDIEKKILVAAIFQGKRYLRATMPKKALVEYWLRGSRSHSLLGYYMRRDGSFFMRIQLQEKRRIKNPLSGELVQRFNYKFYDVIIDKKGACWHLFEDGEETKEPECFFYKNRGY